MSGLRRVGLHPANALVLLGLVLLVAAVPVGSWAIDQIDTLGDGGIDDSGVRLRIVEPVWEAEVTSPFVLQVESEGVTIADPAAGVEGAYHYHAFVNVHPFTPAGEVISTGEGIHHFWDGALELDLEPGTHQIFVTFGDNDHVRPFDLPAVEVVVVVTG